MSIFKSRFAHLKENIRALCIGKNGWYCGDNFSELLKKEVRTSYRTGLPLSYINITLESNIENNSKKITVDSFKVLKKLIHIINSDTRECDIKHLNREFVIDLLLTNTSLVGAKKFTEKISRKLYKQYNTEAEKERQNLLNELKYTVYPLNQHYGNGFIEATPKIVRDLEYKVETHHKYIRSISNLKSHLYINWDTAINGNGRIAVSNPIFWENIIETLYQTSFLYFKRTLDILISFLAILLLAPTMIIISLLIKLTSCGPVLFKQQRIGYLGRSFIFLKFRTMKFNCDDSPHKNYIKEFINGNNTTVNRGNQDKPLYKLTDDSRITKIGHVLRKTSLDEVPQFFNVLTGSMSLVGPRPPISYEVDLYQTWQLRRIAEVKPGITGLWQVSGRNTTTFAEMVRLDLKYVKHQSFLLDIKILLQTFRAVLNTQGAL